MVVSRSRTSAPGYDNLALGGAEMEKLKSLRNLGATLDSKLTCKTHLWEVVSKAAWNMRAVWPSRKVIWLSTCAEELFQWLCFVQLGALCSVWVSLAESHLGLLESA